MQVDVLPAGEDRRRATAVAGPLERLHPPALDPLFLGFGICEVRSTHLDVYNAAPREKVPPVSRLNEHFEWFFAETAPEVLCDRCFAQQRLHLGEEVGNRLHLVFRPESEPFRPLDVSSASTTGASPGIVAYERGELADDACVCLGRVDPQLDLPALRHRLERRDLHCDQLRLTLLLVVDPALDDENTVGDE